jgi:hypothetical protein
MPWGQMKSSMLKLFWLLTTSSLEIRCSTSSIYASVILDNHKRNRGSDLADISDLEHSLIVEGLLCFDDTRQINQFR